MEWIFRGWDAVGNKGWVYGDLTHSKKVLKEEPFLVDRVMVGGYEVDPESVSMCTGIKDENCTMIYGGDIVSVSYNGSHLFNATIVWMDRFGGFYMDEGEGCYSPIPRKHITIIGNVYEQGIKNKE